MLTPRAVAIVGPMAILIGCEGAREDPVLSVQVDVGPEQVVIGSMGDSGHAFGSISDVVVRADGSLLVADRTASEVVHLSPSGDVEAVSGGLGDGPGEFQSPVSIAVLGSDEYVVVDSERFFATRMKIEGSQHSFMETVDLSAQALHACGLEGDLVFDPYFGDKALGRLGSNGDVIAWYGELLDLPDAGLSPRAVEALRGRFGLGYPLCDMEDGLAFVPEWGNRVEGFRKNGDLVWSVQITPHNTFAWEPGPDGRPEVQLPPIGWFHRAVGAVVVEEDLILIQYQELGREVGAQDELASEVRFMRPSDGSQTAVDVELPTIVHIGDGFVWAWRNLPYPQVVKLAFTISSN